MSDKPHQPSASELGERIKEAIRHQGILRKDTEFAIDSLVRLVALATPPQAAEPTYQFEVWQGDECQAMGENGDLEAMRREASHYAMQYAQDGPVEVREFVRYKLGLQARTEGKT